MASVQVTENGDVVMRCRRHRKKFAVPRGWLDICDYLCPKCYGKLTEEERKRYAPSSEKSQRSIQSQQVQSQQSEMKIISDGSGSPQASKNLMVSQDQGECVVRDKEALQNTVSKKSDGKRHEEQGTRKLADNPNLAGLLPRYKIHCKKCGEDVPCHYSWFENSTVLCPSCYAELGEYGAKLFNAVHKDSGEKTIQEFSIPPDQKKISLPKIESVTLVNYSREAKRILRRNESIDDEGRMTGGRWTASHIKGASIKQLMEGVKRGKISKVRCRIEIRRRMNKDYYDMLSMDGGVSRAKLDKRF